MRFISLFRKHFREQKRDLWVLALSMAFAPVFVFIYYLFTGGSGSTRYPVLVLNQDQPVSMPDGSSLDAGTQVTNTLEALAYETGSPLLRVVPVETRMQAEQRLKDRAASLLLIIPEDFSFLLQASQSGLASVQPRVTIVGDLTNPYYTVAALMAFGAVENFTLDYTGQTRPVELQEIALGASGARSEFEMYVPGLLIFAVIILIFQAAMMVAREIEGGRLKRLAMTHMNAFELLGSTSAWLVLVAMLELLLTFAVAVLCGFRSQGQLWLALLVGVVTSFSVIGAGLIVACLSKTVSQAFVIANFPLGFFMCLTGAIFPLPRTDLFRLFGHGVAFADLLPPTHAVNALNKVFTMGAGLGDVSFEISALVLLSGIYFGTGVWLFQRMHLQRK